MRLQDMKPLTEGIALHNVLRTTPPLADVPRAPLWMMLVVGLVDVALWSLIILGGLWICGVVAGWL